MDLAPVEIDKLQSEDMQRTALTAGSTYRQGSFTHMTRAPHVAPELPGLVAVSVSGAHADLYRRIDPARSGQGGTVPDGFVAVLEIFNAERQLVQLDIMVKGPAGFDPSAGDFFYSVTTPDGVQFHRDASGAARAGHLNECIACHTRRAGDAWLFGVPRSELP